MRDAQKRVTYQRIFVNNKERQQTNSENPRQAVKECEKTHLMSLVKIEKTLPIAWKKRITRK